MGRKPPKTAFNKGFTPWNKGIHTGLIPKTAFKKDDIRLVGEVHHNWKGDNASYTAFHIWIRGRLGKPKKCMFCKKKDHLQWANQSGCYMRDIHDYISLCYWCHRKYDKKMGWGKIKERWNHA